MTITLNLKNEDSGKRTAEILLYEAIGGDWFSEGMTAKKFVKDLEALGELDEINLRINSPGGSVFDADAIYNALVRNKARVVVDIDGLAASAASYVAMAGDEIRIAENGHFMIHYAWGGAMGNKDDMRKVADLLDLLDNSIANIYAKRTGGKREDFLALMQAETWMDSARTVELKLAHSITPGKEISACVGPDCPFEKAPKQYVKAAASAELPRVDKAGDILKRFEENKLSFLDPASLVLKGGLTVKGATNMSGKNKTCGCKAKGKKRPANVAGYAALMLAAIDAAVTESRTQDAILQELATAAGMDLEAVTMLLSDEGECPTVEQVDAFATVEGMPTAEEQKLGAETDGCTFEEGGGGEETTPEDRMVDCWSCDGTGVCDYCDGTGILKGDGCTKCEATGICAECEGSGKIQGKAGNNVDDKEGGDVNAKLKQIERDAVKARLAELETHAVSVS